MNKHFKYVAYVMRHKWYVFCACRRRGLLWRGIIHDWSKFLPDEWFPYATHFYGGGHNDEAFNRAWLKHLHRNPHHHQHWVLRLDSAQTLALKMPVNSCIEMICDWEGAGRAITGKKGGTRDWYMKNRDKMLLHPDTRATVEWLLGVPSERPAEG